MIVTFHAVRVVAAKRHIRRRPRRRGVRAACRSRHSAIGKTDDRVDRQMENAAVGRLAWVVSSSRLSPSPSERPSRCMTRAEMSLSYERDRERARERLRKAQSSCTKCIGNFLHPRLSVDARVLFSCQSPTPLTSPISYPYMNNRYSNWRKTKDKWYYIMWKQNEKWFLLLCYILQLIEKIQNYLESVFGKNYDY